MYDYATIVHPTNEDLLHKYEPGMKNKPRPLVKKVLEWMSPFKAAEIEGLKSPLGRTAKGALVMCPLLLEQMVTLSPTKVMKAVIQTIEFARKALNPKLIGLTAYAAFSGNKGEQLAKMLNVSLTTGSNYTLAMLPESILRAAEFMEINLQDAHILLIGATSSVGRYAIEILSHFTCGMFITAHNEDKLGLMLTELPKEKKSKLHRPKDLESVLDKVSIVIIASNRIPADFDLNKLNPGTVIFDASYPRLIFQRPANDLMIIDGVSIKSGNGINYNFDFGLPGGLCFPCMAEPMILALERKFNSYSLGKDFEPDKIREILRLGAKHGFEIATLTSREKVMAEEQMLAVKHNAEKKKKRGLLAWR